MSSQAPVRELQFTVYVLSTNHKAVRYEKNYLGLPTVLVGKVLQLVVSDFWQWFFALCMGNHRSLQGSKSRSESSVRRSKL